MSDDVQDVVESVDERLQEALRLANKYVEHDEVRPSALMAFDHVEKARRDLEKIDEREYENE